MDPKTIIAPLQMWLLGQGRCVGCGRLLAKGKRKPVNGVVQVICSCRRIFLFNPKENSYRRALFSEL